MIHLMNCWMNDVYWIMSSHIPIGLCPRNRSSCGTLLLSFLSTNFSHLFVHLFYLLLINGVMSNSDRIVSDSLIHSQALIVQDEPLASVFGVSWSHTHRHTVGLLWTSDQTVAETSTYTGQHNRQTCGIRTRDPSNQAAEDLRLRPRGHWDRL
jgi:hypothetical protein